AEVVYVRRLYDVGLVPAAQHLPDGSIIHRCVHHIWHSIYSFRLHSKQSAAGVRVLFYVTSALCLLPRLRALAPERSPGPRTAEPPADCLRGRQAPRRKTGAWTTGRSVSEE
ncbi:Protein of unknown function, partial [Gryllus bimaculatus]